MRRPGSAVAADVFLSLMIISPGEKAGVPAAKAGVPGAKSGVVERCFPCPGDGAPEKTGVPAVANRVRTSKLVTATDLRIFFQSSGNLVASDWGNVSLYTNCGVVSSAGGLLALPRPGAS